MSLSGRRIALVCMTPEVDADELGGMELPSYGIRRIFAAVASEPALDGAQIGLVDRRRADIDGYVDALEHFGPALIGFSIYVWSTPCLVEVARRYKRRHPECVIVFGGPSARTELFDLAPYAPAHEYLDAVVATEGEETFREIARLPRLEASALDKIPGLDRPVTNGWRSTGPRPLIRALDDIASPFQMGFMRGDVAYLETYRGCPLSCRFCEWGASGHARGEFSVDYLCRELEAYARSQVGAVFLIDAGLNLNARAFRNLNEAESRTQVLRRMSLWCEVYPSKVREEHLEFLDRVGASYLGIGLQSLDAAVLKAHQRPFGVERFETAVAALSGVANVEIQIIFGLPDDSPEGFLRTLAYARSMSADVRAYHCLVLPDALMSRSRPEWQLDFDPFTLEMRACPGWPPGTIQDMREHMTREALAAGGKAGDFWWYFPRSA